MVDENLVRKDISFGEMAELARRYAADPDTDCNDADKAVAVLYKSAGYQKRSYIRAFVAVLDEIGDALEHAHAIPRSLGLALRKRMEAMPEIGAKIRADLAQWHDRPVNDELDVLRKYAGGAGGAETFPAGKVAKPPAPRKAKTTFQIARAEGPAKCSASNGRLELRLDRDFSAIDRRKLETAVQKLLDALE